MLVKPLLPSHLSELLDANQESETAYRCSKTLKRLARDLEHGENTDARLDARACREELEHVLEEVRTNPCAEESTSRVSLEAKLFAANVIECLCHLRLNDVKAADAALARAKKLSVRKDCSISKLVVLESLGLISSLVTELEDKLARIEPCLFLSTWSVGLEKFGSKTAESGNPQ